jgi:enoyl-CoA hydratase/carnithine racemase
MLRPVGASVRYELDGPVATLTLDRPERLNAIVPALVDDLEAALDRAEADDAVRAVRLRGAGRAFCAGYDIDWGARAMEEAEGGAAWDPMADYRMMSRFVRGMASESHPAEELDAAALALAQRVARLPANQLQMMKLLVNQAYEQMGLAGTQLVGTLLDGAARHTPEGLAFTRAAMEDVRAAVAARDAPFGDYGQERR